MSEQFKNFDELFSVESGESEAERNARIRAESHDAKPAANAAGGKKNAKLKGDLSGKSAGSSGKGGSKKKSSGKIKSTMGESGSKNAAPAKMPEGAKNAKNAESSVKNTPNSAGSAKHAPTASSAAKNAPRSGNGGKQSLRKNNAKRNAAKRASRPESVKSEPITSAASFVEESMSAPAPAVKPEAPAASGNKAAKNEKKAAKRDAKAEKAAKRAKEEVVPENWTPSDPPIRHRRDGRSGCLGGLVFFAFVLSLSIILACVGWMAASDVLALNKDPITATVTLDKTKFETREEPVEHEDGSTTKEKVRYADLDYVAGVLKDAGIIEYKGLFKLYCSFSHASKHIDPGTYELSTNFDYRALVKKMQVGTGAMVTTKVTIPEGFSMEQIFRRLEKEDVCSYEDLMNAAANYQYNYSFLDEAQLGNASRLEGFLFPDTYEFYQGMQASSAINKFLVNFHNRLTKEMMDIASQRGFTLQQMVTIASMIEKEAANDEERALISSVIYNRMNQGMPLQIDSTIMYVLPEHGDVLTHEETQIDSPYNTYMYTGLPPTPIANPGLASINAALRPTQTNYMYYALDAETGTHQFFTSYGEFESFVSRQNYMG